MVDLVLPGTRTLIESDFKNTFRRPPLFGVGFGDHHGQGTLAERVQLYAFRSLAALIFLSLPKVFVAGFLFGAVAHDVAEAMAQSIQDNLPTTLFRRSWVGVVAMVLGALAVLDFLILVGCFLVGANIGADCYRSAHVGY